MKLTKDDLEKEDLEKELLNVFKKSIKHKETAIEYHEIHIHLLQESISKLKPRLENTSGSFKKTISQTITEELEDDLKNHIKKHNEYKNKKSEIEKKIQNIKNNQIPVKEINDIVKKLNNGDLVTVGFSYRVGEPYYQALDFLKISDKNITDPKDFKYCHTYSDSKYQMDWSGQIGYSKKELLHKLFEGGNPKTIKILKIKKNKDIGR